MGDIFANDNKLLDDARAVDIKAKKNNQIIGRIISYQVADGNALYIVTKERSNGDFEVKYLDIFDGNMSPPIEDLGRVLPKRMVLNHFGLILKNDCNN